MRDSFEGIEAPSIWNERLQEIYEERIKYLINQWTTHKHLRILGLDKQTLSDLYLDKNSLVTYNFINDIIEYLKAKVS